MAFNEKLYDELYQKAEEFLARVNPCKVQNGECLRKYKYNGRNFCCGGCEHIKKEGCSADKPLACKAWLCYQAYNELSSAEKFEQKMIEAEINRNGFFVHRGTKKDVKGNIMYLERKEREEE